MKLAQPNAPSPRQHLTAQTAPTLDQRPAQQVESDDKDDQYANVVTKAAHHMDTREATRSR